MTLRSVERCRLTTIGRLSVHMQRIRLLWDSVVGAKTVSDSHLELISITMKRYQWEDIVLILERYIAILRGERGFDEEDIVWADELGWLTDELKQLITTHTAPPSATAETHASYDATTGQTASFPGHSRNDAWTSAEIEATIDAYFDMLDNDLVSHSYVKTHVYRALHERFPNRSVKAFERKMQNISAVMERHELPWVRGLAPLRNMQADLAIAVENRLVEREETGRIR